MAADSTLTQVMEKVRNWLVEEGIYKDALPDQEATFHFIVNFPPNSPHILHIIQPKMRKDLLLFMGGIELSKEHYEALKALPKAQRDQILWDMKFQLLFKAVDFQMTPNLEELKALQFTKPVYFDGLNKNEFMNGLREVFKCILFIIWKMVQLFGERPVTRTTPLYS
jgi:hypothetical protein